MDLRRIITALIFINLAYLVAACGQQPIAKSRKPAPKIAPGDISAVPFEIAKVDDASHKATTKPISAYTTAQLAALPMSKKVICKILVPGTIKRTQVKPTVDKIIFELTGQDLDLDEIELFLFISHPELESSESATEFATTFDDTNTYSETVNSKYDVAYASWHPGLMTRGKVTPALAVSNEHNDYETDIKIRENLEEYLEQKETFKEDFDLTELEKKAVYLDIMAAKEKSAEKARKMFPGDARKAALKEAELQKQADADLRAEHIVTDEMLKDITEEGNALGWPKK